MMRGVLVRTGRKPYRDVEPEFGVMSFDGKAVAPIFSHDEIRFDCGAGGKIWGGPVSWMLNSAIPLTNLLGHPCVVTTAGVEGRVRKVKQNV